MVCLRRADRAHQVIIFFRLILLAGGNFNKYSSNSLRLRSLFFILCFGFYSGNVYTPFVVFSSLFVSPFVVGCADWPFVNPFCVTSACGSLVVFVSCTAVSFSSDTVTATLVVFVSCTSVSFSSDTVTTTGAGRCDIRSLFFSSPLLGTKKQLDSLKRQEISR